MTAMQPLTDLLRSLPSGVRKTLYALIVVLGAVLAILDAAGVTDLGPITVDQALQIYAYVSPVAGVVAVANVGRPSTAAEAEAEAGMPAYDEDADLSSFQPVGDVEEVYGQAAW